MIEVKVKVVGISERVLVQIIVFFLFQRQRYFNFRIFLILNILFFLDYIQIIMYDVVNDVLLCSNFIDLFNVNVDGYFFSEVVVILWFVLYYRIFCCGLYFKDNVEVEIFKLNFYSLIKEKWNVYTKYLKSCVSCFLVIDKEIKVDIWNRKVF